MTQRDTREDIANGNMAHYWRLELEHASKAEKAYRSRAKELIRKYSGEDELEFNILWSNIETLKPAVYSNTAQPDVRRRFRGGDPVGRDIAIGLERAVRYSCDEYDFDENIRLIRDECLITGRGVGRCEYEVDTVEIEVPRMVMLEDGSISMESEMQEAIANQTAKIKYVHFDDYRQSPAKCWDDVRWVAFRHTPTRKEGVEQFGDKFNKVPLTYKLFDGEDDYDEKINEEILKRAEVWEIWDKEKRERVWFAVGFGQLLEVEEDPYELEGFFPMPKPLYAYRIPGTMVPRSEYDIYRKQVEILNKTTRKINELNDQLKVTGFYNSVNEEVTKIMTASNGKFIPITSMAMDMSVKDMIAFWPVEEIAKVIIQLYQAQDNQIKIIYQVTGISDIVRGDTKASETARAQSLKGNFAQMRMTPRTQPIQEMIRDLFRIKAELIAEHYTAERLQEMTQIEFTEVMMQIMRDDKLRSYRIDVETDSTVQPDANADKQRRIEFLQAVSTFIQNTAPLVQAGILPAEVAKEMLGFGVRGFKVGRQLEEALDSIGEAEGGQPQPQQPQGPSPEEIKAQQEQQKFAIETQMKAEEAKLKAQSESEKISTDMQKHQDDVAIKVAELQHKKQMDLAEIELKNIEQQIKMKELELKQLQVGEGAVNNQPIVVSGSSDNALQEMMRYFMESQAESNENMQRLVSAMSAPKEIVRDASGRVVGAKIASEE